jgi:hypothetical protein
MERPAHRVSFGGARDAETGEDAAMSPVSPPGVAGSPQRPEYNPKSKRRHGLARRAVAAVKEAGAAKIISGAISVFLLFSVFSVSHQLASSSGTCPRAADIGRTSACLRAGKAVGRCTVPVGQVDVTASVGTQSLSRTVLAGDCWHQQRAGAPKEGVCTSPCARAAANRNAKGSCRQGRSLPRSALLRCGPCGALHVV